MSRWARAAWLVAVIVGVASIVAAVLIPDRVCTYGTDYGGCTGYREFRVMFAILGVGLLLAAAFVLVRQRGRSKA